MHKRLIARTHLQLPVIFVNECTHTHSHTHSLMCSTCSVCLLQSIFAFAFAIRCILYFFLRLLWHGHGMRVPTFQLRGVSITIQPIRPSLPLFPSVLSWLSAVHSGCSALGFRHTLYEGTLCHLTQLKCCSRLESLKYYGLRCASPWGSVIPGSVPT